MTVFPEEPKLTPMVEGCKFRYLEERHTTCVELGLGFSLIVSIAPGYWTDGASVPQFSKEDEKTVAKIRKLVKKEYPKILTSFDLDSLIRSLIGTPWEMPRLLAAVVHDALYGLHWGIRWLCDIVFNLIERAAGYDERRADIEYACLRLAGWKSWDEVSKDEIGETKKYVTVEVARTKNVQKKLDRLAPKWRRADFRSLHR